MLNEWLKSALQTSGMSGAELARRLDSELPRAFDRSTVQKMLSGARMIKADEMMAIERITGCPPPSTNAKAKTGSRLVRRVEVVGEVAAGVWQEVNDGAFERYATALAVDPRWPDDAVFALVVRGNSINRRAPDGALVVCLDARRAPRSARSGDWIVAKRMRNGFCETTVKQYRLADDGAVELWPDSTDARFKDPIRPGDSESDDVEIAAFVLEFVHPGTRF